MTIIWKMGIALAVVAVVAMVQPQCAFACSCRPPGPPAETLANATAVFSGRVTAVALPADTGGPLPVQVTFAVAQTWKGTNRSTIVVNTPASSASCGVDFVQGQEYLVYALENEGTLQTNLCSRTAPLGSAGEDLAVLGAGGAPVPSAGGAETPTNLPATGVQTYTLERQATIAGVALLIILFGAAIARRRSAA